ncbi:glycosyltransferase family 4 protein [Negadavirga shengliensis]|uniref:Glycosyltransferase family 4 protein n=1 Tax=Negadavirga shengliensis TaxID=1389218 RepID=A0ABV9SUN6_9BACT
MRIIYIHQYYLTPREGGAIRSYHLSKGMAAAGVEVEVITAHNAPDYKCVAFDGVKVHYLPVPYDNAFGVLKRMGAFYAFVRKAKALIFQMVKPDLFFITSTPLTTGIIGLWAKRKWGIPYVFEVRDLWPEAPVQLGVIRNLFLKKYLYGLEEKIYGNAQKIVALSPGIEKYIHKKCREASIAVIPNFADMDFFQSELANPDVLELQPEKLTIAYTGAVGKVNGLESYLQLAAEAQKLGKPWQFVLMGKGAELSSLKKRSKQLGLLNFHFLSYGDKNAVRDLLAFSDLVYISFQDLPVLRTSSPNKFFDALAMGKPVIVNFKGWLLDMIKQNDMGNYHDQEDSSKILSYIQSLEEDPAMLERAGKNAERLAESRFSKKEAVSRLLDFLDS